MFISDIFNNYQVKEIDEMNTLIIAFMNQGKFEHAKGAMDLANKIIKLPSRISTSPDVKARMHENIKRFQSNFIRSAGNDD